MNANTNPPKQNWALKIEQGSVIATAVVAATKAVTCENATKEMWDTYYVVRNCRPYGHESYTASGTTKRRSNRSSWIAEHLVLGLGRIHQGIGSKMKENRRCQCPTHQSNTGKRSKEGRFVFPAQHRTNSGRTKPLRGVELSTGYRWSLCACTGALCGRWTFFPW